MSNKMVQVVGNLHWVLVVIDVKARRFRYYDSMHGVGAAHVLVTARRWLLDEVAARLGKEVARACEIRGCQVMHFEAK